MSILEILLLLIVAGICGGIGQGLSGYSHGGCVISIIIGFIGALLGKWIAQKLLLPDLFEISIGGHSFPVLWSIIGGALFTGFLNFLSPKRRR